MHLAGESEIAASRERVWATLSHPERFGASTHQGSAEIERIDDRHFRVAVSPAGLPVQVVLEVELTELTERSRIVADVSGVVMGGPITGTGSVDLVELGPKLTRATWVADATLGGMLGGFDGMLAGPLQQAADGAFATLKARLEAEEAGATA